MQTNRKIILRGAIIAGVLWIVSLTYYITGTLKEPLFIKQYIEVGYRYSDQILLNYITQDKQMSVSYVELPELTHSYIPVEDRSVQGDGRNIGRQASIDIRRLMENNEQLMTWWKHQSAQGESIKLTQMNVYMNSSEGMKMYPLEIGEIYLLPLPEYIINDEEYQEKEALIEFQMGSSSSDYSGKTVGIAHKDININEPTSNLKSEIMNTFEVFINDEPLELIEFPITLARGKTLTVNYKLREELNEQMSSSGLGSKLIFLVSDKEGKQDEFVVHLEYLTYNQPRLDRKYIKWLKEEGEVYDREYK